MRALLADLAGSLYAWLRPDPINVPGDAHFRYWADDKLWYYALVSGNNEPLVLSSQGYANKAAVLRAIGQCKRNSAIAEAIGTPKGPTE